MNGATFGNKLKRTVTIVMLVAIAVAVIWGVRTCNSYQAQQKAEEMQRERRDSTIRAVINRHSRLYTAEAKSRKTITYTSDNTFKVKIAGMEKNIKLPLGRTEATIPVIVTYKAYIDLQRVTAADFHVSGDTTIVITLPDPVIVETAVAIDHDQEKMKKQWLAKSLTYEQYQSLVRKAKDEAWEELSINDQTNIIETAKVSATDILLPQLRQLGFKNIRIDYREDFDIMDIIREKRR